MRKAGLLGTDKQVHEAIHSRENPSSLPAEERELLSGRCLIGSIKAIFIARRTHEPRRAKIQPSNAPPRIWTTTVKLKNSFEGEYALLEG